MFAAHNDTSGLVTNNGDVYIWGLDFCHIKYQQNHGDIAIPMIIPRVRFQNNNVITSKLNTIEDKIVSLSIGKYDYGVITENGRLYMWGNNNFGNIGDGTRKTKYTPTLLPPSAFNNEKIIAVSLGYYYSGCITEHGHIYMWGRNFYGQLGLGYYEDRYEPTLVPPSYFNNEKVIALSLGSSHCGAITESGQLYMWGYNPLNDLIDDVTMQQNTPLLIPLSYFNDEKISIISLGDSFSGIVTKSGKIYMWGDNFNGQVGDGSDIDQISSPVLIDPSYFNNEKIILLCLGGRHSGAITESGKLYMWGSNTDGQLGLGDTQNRNIPSLVPPITFNNERIISLSLGYYHSGVVTETLKVYTCGYNIFGQLGLGDTKDRLKFEIIKNFNYKG